MVSPVSREREREKEREKEREREREREIEWMVRVTYKKTDRLLQCNPSTPTTPTKTRHPAEQSTNREGKKNKMKRNVKCACSVGLLLREWKS